MTSSTRAAADAPIRWPPAVVSENRTAQRSRRHAWPSVDGLAVALGPLWALLQLVTAPSVFAPSCDGARTDGAAAAATLTGPPRQDDRRMRLVVRFRSAPYWLSESEHRPNARVSTAFTYTYMRCRSSNSRHCCCPRMAAVGPSTP